MPIHGGKNSDAVEGEGNVGRDAGNSTRRRFTKIAGEMLPARSYSGRVCCNFCWILQARIPVSLSRLLSRATREKRQKRTARQTGGESVSRERGRRSLYEMFTYAILIGEGVIIARSAFSSMSTSYIYYLSSCTYPQTQGIYPGRTPDGNPSACISPTAVLYPLIYEAFALM